MRVSSCKIHYPSLICFCKPSPATHLYDSGGLKLENQNPPQDASRHLPPVVQQNQIKEENSAENGDTVLRSCIKKAPASVEKKKVQWVDSLGKQLVDIKEFESSETGDSDNEEENGGCLCKIFFNNTACCRNNSIDN